MSKIDLSALKNLSSQTNLPSQPPIEVKEEVLIAPIPESPVPPASGESKKQKISLFSMNQPVLPSQEKKSETSSNSSETTQQLIIENPSTEEIPGGKEPQEEEIPDIKKQELLNEYLSGLEILTEDFDKDDSWKKQESPEQSIVITPPKKQISLQALEDLNTNEPLPKTEEVLPQEEIPDLQKPLEPSEISEPLEISEQEKLQENIQEDASAQIQEEVLPQEGIDSKTEEVLPQEEIPELQKPLEPSEIPEPPEVSEQENLQENIQEDASAQIQEEVSQKEENSGKIEELIFSGEKVSQDAPVLNAINPQEQSSQKKILSKIFIGITGTAIIILSFLVFFLYQKFQNIPSGDYIEVKDLEKILQVASGSIRSETTIINGISVTTRENNKRNTGSLKKTNSGALRGTGSQSSE